MEDPKRESSVPFLKEDDEETHWDNEFDEEGWDKDQDGIEINFNTEDAKAQRCLICLKSYGLLVLLIILACSVYLLTNFRNTEQFRASQKEEVGQNTLGQTTGFKELRLGGRRVYYAIQEPTEIMPNRTMLLVHGDYQNGEIFNKLGTMEFLASHGVRAVFVDVIGYGRSDPPIHIPDSYEDFFDEIITLLDLQYNLMFACLEQGCQKLLPYYLHRGVYNPDNNFILGSVFVSPRGTTFSNYIRAENINLPTGVRTIIVNGEKDEFVNMEVTKQMSLVPRCELHPLPGFRNSFYSGKNSKMYFHGAIQALLEHKVYEYDTELKNQTNSTESSWEQGAVGEGSVQQAPNRQHQAPQEGDAFSRYLAKQKAEQQRRAEMASTFNHRGYNPARRFEEIKGQK